ncbi:MAG: hypothetical protein JO325_15280 [Solirubrobacterales bacterium]|nr:hypothetical protein [Solirubrobacterales bacterium]
MTDQADGDGHAGELESLVVVRVEDTIDPRLSGLTGGIPEPTAEAPTSIDTRGAPGRLRR